MATSREAVAAINAVLDKVDAGLDTAQTAATGITGDVTFLKARIAELEANPDDQAAWDALVSRVQGMDTKTANLATGLKAVDDATERPS